MHRNHRGVAGVLTSVAVLAGVGLVSGPSATAVDGGSQKAAGIQGSTLTNFGFDATAYGSKTDGNNMADSDGTAVSHLPCTRFVPRDRRNHVANSNEGGVRVENADTHNSSRQRDGVTTARSVATVESGAWPAAR